MSNSYTFFVAGIPVPKGSAKSFYNKNAGKIVTMQDNRERQEPWASAISYTAQKYGVKMCLGAVKLSLIFTFPRPKSHYRTGKYSRQLRPSAPVFHVVKPDLDKLVRCVKDALTGVAWKDDCQVSRFGDVSKTYGDKPGVFITIEAAR